MARRSILVRRPGGVAGPPPANLGSSPLARWQLDTAPPDGQRLTLARGAEARRAYHAACAEWRLLTAAALTGLGDRALEIGAEYAKTRIQFGRPIGSFQGLAHPMADAATELFGARMLVQYAIWSVATAQPQALARVAFAFVAAAESANRAAAKIALHVHGGYGISLEYDIQLYYRRAKAWSLAGGNPDDELQRAAGILLGEGEEPAALPDAGPCGLDFGLGDEAERFRAEARAFFERAITPELREKAHFSFDGYDAGFQRQLGEAGLLYPDWPSEFGGRDLGPYEITALWEEYKRAGWTTHAGMTTGMVGQTLIRFASEELKREVLPRVLAGEAIISLGYTEPGSGSDVAAAQTRAVQDGEFWQIDGQKMFTSGANLGQYVFLLTRTDADAKHKGLTMFLVPLDSEGIEVHPVKHALGRAHQRDLLQRRPGARPLSRRQGQRRLEGGRLRPRDRARLGHRGRKPVHGQHGAGREGPGLGPRGRARWSPGRRTIPRVREGVARAAMHADMAFVIGRRALWCSATDQPQAGEGPMNKLFGSEILHADADNLLDLMAPGLAFPRGRGGRRRRRRPRVLLPARGRGHHLRGHQRGDAKSDRADRCWGFPRGSPERPRARGGQPPRKMHSPCTSSPRPFCAPPCRWISPT